MRKLLPILILVATPFVANGYAQEMQAESAAWGSRTSGSSEPKASSAAWGSRTSGSSTPKTERIAPDLRGAMGKSDRHMVDVIVQYRGGATDAHHEKVRAMGGQLKKSLDVIKGSLYTLPASAVQNLADDDDVVYITPDRALQANDMVTNVTAGANVAQNWGYTGNNMAVAVIDSGIQDTNDVKASRILYRQDWTNSKTKDSYGHGTHVAGIIGSTNSQYGGVAPGVNFVDLDVLDQNGSGKDSDVIAAIYKAISLANKYNITVINLSLGRGIQESYQKDPLCQAVEAAWQAGIVVVVAAGNDGRNDKTKGYGMINSPGNDPYVITVGAMKTEGTTNRGDDLMTTYSSKGPTCLDHVVKPDLVAPGNLLVSNMPTDSYLYKHYSDNIVSPGYFKLSGTSMATPVVSGAVLLMLDKNSWLSPDMIKARLMKSASKNFPKSSVYYDPTTKTTYTTQYDIFTVGAGYLDIMAALQSNDYAFGAALSPKVSYNSSTKTVKLVAGNAFGLSLTWGSSVAWGNSVVWGSSVLGDDDFSIAWGSSVVWGSDASDGFSLIWGSSVTWGSSTIAGESSPVSIIGEN